MKDRTRRNRKITYLLYILISLIGLLEYLPIPNLPDYIISFIQRVSFFTPWFSVFAIVIVQLFVRDKKIGPVVIMILLFVGIFPSIMRDFSNRLIISINKNREFKDVINPISGTLLIRKEKYVEFAWNLLPQEYESMIYNPRHGLTSDNMQREIIEVINEDWYVMRTGLFE